jgi:prepilin-type N-terminal cleavage/methylation domain-containing protein
MWFCIFTFKLFTAEGLARFMLKVTKLVKIPTMTMQTIKNKKQHGFTLIEILVVMAIIGILELF